MNPNESRGSGAGGGSAFGEAPMRRTDHRGSASAGAGAKGGRAAGSYGREEVSALKGIFNLYDAEETGTIGIKELEGILQKLGYNPGEIRTYDMYSYVVILVCCLWATDWFFYSTRRELFRCYRAGQRLTFPCGI